MQAVNVDALRSEFEHGQRLRDVLVETSIRYAKAGRSEDARRINIAIRELDAAENEKMKAVIDAARAATI